MGFNEIVNSNSVPISKSEIHQRQPAFGEVFLATSAPQLTSPSSKLTSHQFWCSLTEVFDLEVSRFRYSETFFSFSRRYVLKWERKPKAKLEYNFLKVSLYFLAIFFALHVHVVLKSFELAVLEFY